MSTDKLISMITNLEKKMDTIDRKLNNCINNINTNNNLTPYNRQFTMDEFNVVLNLLRNNYLENYANDYCPDILLVRYQYIIIIILIRYIIIILYYKRNNIKTIYIIEL